MIQRVASSMLQQRPSSQCLGFRKLTRVSVILIPGFGTPKVESWSIVKQEAQLLSPSARLYLLRYEYEIALDSNFSWKKLKDEGKCLLDCIRDRISVCLMRCVWNTSLLTFITVGQSSHHPDEP